MIDLLDDLGYDALDAGPLAEGWRFQRDTAAYANIYADGGDFETPVPRDAAYVADQLAQSKRYADM